MIRTNNRRAVFGLAKKSLRASPVRNWMIIGAVVLTALMITSIFTVTVSLNQSMEQTQMRTAGGDYHGTFKYLTRGESDTLKQHPSIKEYGMSLVVGWVTNEEFKTSSIEVNSIDDNTAKHSFVEFIEGGLPVDEDGIVMNTWALEKLGVPLELGATVPLEIDINGQKISKDFKLSGYYKADQYLAMAGLAFVSPSFVDKYVAQIDPEQTRLSGTYVNTISLNVMFNNSWNIREKLDKVLADTGLDTPTGVNWAYSSVSLFDDAVNLLPYVALILVIMLSGYLLIYNIFYISVVRDIKFYGLLKTIGTTPRQLKRIIVIQANLLFIIGLPIGLGLGYGLGCLLIPMLTSFSDLTMDISYSVSPWIFIGAAIFSYITVRISASKPGRIAARISPVEAVKYAGVSKTGRRGLKRTLHGSKIYKMALGNLLRNKKKVILMLASLSLGLILFSMIYTLISSMNVNKYLNSFIAGDYVVKDEIMEVKTGVSENGTYALTEEVVQGLSQIAGVDRVDKVYFKTDTLPMSAEVRALLEPLAKEENPDMPMYSPLLETGQLSIQVYELDEGWYDVLNQSDIAAGEFDREKFKTGKYVLVSEAILDESEQSFYRPGDKIEWGQSGKSYEVMAVVKLDALYAAGVKFYDIAGVRAFLPLQESKSSQPDSIILNATLHVDPNQADLADTVIRAYTDSVPGLILKSRDDYKAEMQGFITIFQTVGYGLSFIIGLIGLMNFMNTMITGIIARRHEFAILESIGMTKKQLRKMLIYEGLYVVVFTAVILGTFGMLLTYGLIKSIAENIAFTVFHMDVLPIAASIPLLAIISIVVTVLAYRMLAKDTVVARLREVE